MKLIQTRSRTRTFWFNPDEVASIDKHIHHQSTCVTDPKSQYFCTTQTTVSARHRAHPGEPNIWFDSDEAPEVVVANIEEATR